MKLIALGITSAFLAGLAHGAIVLPTTDVSDGTLNPTAATTVIDLSQAASATWNTPSPAPGKGVYDGAKWAVVFKYSSVQITAGRTVEFLNHSSRAPVVWLVNGNVTIDGEIELSGQNHSVGTIPEPGPGGFRGGIHTVNPLLPAAGGFGPGGGAPPGILPPGGSHGTLGGTAQAGATYGNPLIVPLIGGSGGAGRTNNTYSGGGGGGAILIAATGTITINGSVLANGGSGVIAGGGSGGAIRLLADTVTGNGRLRALGGEGANVGGEGRIRVEANTVGNLLSAIPATSASAPANPPVVWAPDTAPTVRVVSVSGSPAPADPRGSLGPAPADLRLDSTVPVAVVVETKNVSTTARVIVRVIPKHGNPVNVSAAFSSGNGTTATWTANVTFPQGSSVIQARVDPAS